MPEVVIERAFWFTAALVLTLVGVIYRLFNGSIQKDLKIHKNDIKSEVVEYMDLKVANEITYFDLKFTSDVKGINNKILRIKEDIEEIRKRDKDDKQALLLEELLIRLKDKTKEQ